MTPNDQDIHTLHRYYIWSLNLRDQFYKVVELQGEPPEEGTTEHALWLIKPFMYGSLWFSMLYVVVEGYQELSIDCPGINQLLDTPSLTSLRRLRNGAFHYQRNYFDARFTEYFTDENVKWAVGLQDKLGDYFLSLDLLLDEAND